MIPGYHDACSRELINLALANKALAKAKPGAMRLRLVSTADFRKSEHTNFTALAGKHAIKLGKHDVVAFWSQSKNQLVFVYATDEVEVRPGIKKKVLRSERLRLENGQSWNPLMLANYASQVGIKLDGLKTFEDHYAKLARDSMKAVAKRLGVSKELRA
jgi:hypothetical protein